MGARTAADDAGAAGASGAAFSEQCCALCCASCLHSLTLAGYVWGRSGSCQCCGELDPGILATCYLWPPSPQGAFMHESQQLPMGKRDLAAGDTSGAELVLGAEPRHSPPHRQLAWALRGKWLLFGHRLARPVQSRKASGEGILAFGCPYAGVGV